MVANSEQVCFCFENINYVLYLGPRPSVWRRVSVQASIRPGQEGAYAVTDLISIGNFTSSYAVKFIHFNRYGDRCRFMQRCERQKPCQDYTVLVEENSAAVPKHRTNVSSRSKSLLSIKRAEEPSTRMVLKYYRGPSIRVIASVVCSGDYT